MRAVIRRGGGNVDGLPGMIEEVVVADLRDCAEQPALLAGVDAIVHLAARVHRFDASRRGVEAAYRRDNADLTRALAEQAAASGVRRFLFMSSVKALAERSGDRPLRRGDAALPEDAYGRSKLAAEHSLAEVSHRAGIEVAVVRAPMIYGPQVRANFRSLVNAVARGMPLPFGAVENRRSIVSVWNVADFVVRCLGPLPSAYQVFHVADTRVLSTRELIHEIGVALGREARLVAVPPALLSMALRVAGKGQWVDRLMNSLEIDTSESYELLDWRPPLSLEEGLARTIAEMGP